MATYSQPQQQPYTAANGSPPAYQGGYTDPSAGGGYNSSGSYSAGTQPGGNNYPDGIYGPGKDGSGTALGTLTPNELTSYNLQGLLAGNSPYITQARTQATQMANSRGLLNSSIAAGNAQAAAIQAALPIASQDAQASYGLQQTNLDNLAKAKLAGIAASGERVAAMASQNAMVKTAEINNQGELQRLMDQLGYSGEQAQLNYQRQLGLSQQGFYNESALSGQNFLQNYTASSGLSAQNYQQNLGLDRFNLGSTLLSGMQNFAYSAGLNAMNNPAIMGDPQSFGGYMQFISNVFGGNGMIDNIFNSLFGQYNPTSQPQRVGG